MIELPAGELIMWPLMPLNNKHIVLVMQANTIICGIIERSKKQQLRLEAYERIEYPCATAYLKASFLRPFISTHKLSYCFASIALEEPFIIEHLTPMIKASPSRHEFSSPALKKLLWDYRYLHATDDGTHLFYVCGIKPDLFFTLRLLTYQLNLNLITVTSSYMTRIHAYQSLFGSAFRLSQLGVDLQKTNYALDKSISSDSLTRLLYISPLLNLNHVQEKASLLSMIGLTALYKDLV